MQDHPGPPGERSPLSVVQLELHGSPPVARSRIDGSTEKRFSAPGFSLAGRRELPPPVVTPTCLGRFPHPSLRQLPRDERVTVPGQITKAGVSKSIGGDPCRQVQPTPHLDHLHCRSEPGLTSVVPPQSLPCLPASLAQLVRRKHAFGSVPGQLLRECISGVHSREGSSFEPIHFRVDSPYRASGSWEEPFAYGRTPRSRHPGR